ncbi:PREDICTED: pentatricopeptide repeat-containing protein At4g39530-like [Tarenaya hassleriana]|uniref:pentatricopeptide repeat-containing protein At4g39530-like n=1 Tax=Tarenaya hassleriana TaxID=28532 RepID=UPI00053C8091|nr:PREDICTED: pentatricopeptide repeat-containing protein At4g39530-like [Tarenaya hassleriana]XP_010541029.1 PREDICTED: pentatricopeptide repeat-containing protein At4g39530-like [Tarenaya hassleriana]XP_010541030.1 PREDICTED: pentatricopeptide repeat-containing protein At4g39530-like [Tarenaya hassleriana]
MSGNLRLFSLCSSACPSSQLSRFRFLKSRLSCFASALGSDESPHRHDTHDEFFALLSGESHGKNSGSVREIPSRLDGKQRLKKYSSLLHDCVSRGFLIEGKSVHGNLIRCDIELDSYLWVSLVNFYAKSGQLRYARKVLALMPGRDVVAWTALISGCVDEGYGSDAAVLFSGLRRDGIRPNEFALPIALKACSLCSDLKFGEQVHTEGLKLGFGLDFVFASCLVDAYAKCGKIDYARRVFFDMPVKNVVAWNVLLNSYAEMGEEKDVLGLFQGITSPEIKFNAYTFSTVFKSCANSGNARGGKVVHCVMIRSCYELDNYSSCALVDMYSKCGLANEALTVFKMTRYPDVATWSSIIDCLAQNGKTVEMVNVFKQMRHSGVSPNDFTFATILRGASSDFDYQWFGQSIHAFILKQGFASQTQVGNALVTMYMRYGCVAQGNQVFEEMELRDSVSWNALLAGFENTGQRSRIFRLMLRQGFLPTLDTYINVLVSCSRILSMNVGKQVHAHVVKNCFGSNDYILTTLGEMYMESGCLEDAALCLDMLTERDHHSWTAIIKGYRKNDQPDNAVMCFSEMQWQGVKPNEFILSSCLDACSSMKSVQVGSLLHSMSIKSGFSDDIFIGSSLITMYGECGCIEEAEGVFKGMVVRDLVMWNAMICVYSRCGFREKALEAVVMMVEDGVMPDDITVNNVLFACNDVHFIEQARRLFNSWQHLYGMIPAMTMKQQHHAASE